MILIRDISTLTLNFLLDFDILDYFNGVILRWNYGNS